MRALEPALAGQPHSTAGYRFGLGTGHDGPAMIQPPLMISALRTFEAAARTGKRHLSHRLLAGYDAIVDALYKAWNQLTPKRLNTLTNDPYISQVRI